VRDDTVGLLALHVRHGVVLDGDVEEPGSRHARAPVVGHASDRHPLAPVDVEVDLTCTKHEEERRGR
jgi:hypothetical protein